LHDVKENNPSSLFYKFASYFTTIKTTHIPFMQQLATDKSNQLSVVKGVFYVFLSVAFFLFCVKLMVASLGGFAGSFQENILSSALDPFIGLFIGLLATAIIQSSSTTSTMVVAMVATGTLTIEEAIPVIMGANVGTTLTSTIVALGFISDKGSFRKAVSAGIIHDFFNILMVLILFPLEYYYGFLSKISVYLQQAIFGDRVIESVGDWKWFFDLGIADSISGLIQNDIVMMILSFVLLFLSIKLLTSVIRKSVIGDSQNKLRKFVFQKPIKSFGWGVLITSAIQSSSVSTSLLVPLVATKKIRLTHAFPFIIGANMGTTLTALIAASFSSETAMSIAIAHLLFNLSGALLFMLFAGARDGMVSFAKKFSNVITRKRVIGLVYVVVTFFLLPFLLISIHKTQIDKTSVSEEKEVLKIDNNK